jgi:arylsulfatase A-like enzyme/tetratricopeptide (TPR) repeat protein
MREKQVRTNNKRSRRQGKPRLPWLALPLIIAAAGVLVYKFAPRSPASRVSSLWSARGVEKPNVILVTLDTTRADHLRCYGNPNARTPALDALAGRGVLFEQTATAAPLTLPAHSTIMTGMYPTYHGVRVNGNTALNDGQTTLAEVLAAQGYKTGAFIGAFVLDGRWGLKQGFERYDDQFDLKRYRHIDLASVQRPGNEVMDAALGWLESRKNDPFFAWIHLYDPHAPYEPPEPYRSEYGGRGPAGLYDGEIAFMDEQIGRLAAWLERTGVDRSTVLVLVGDHGEGLGSHGEGTHGYYAYDYAIHVPLIVVAPFGRLAGTRISTQVSTADIFPTVLGLLDLVSPVKVQGRPLVRLMFKPSPKDNVPAYSESTGPNLQFGWSPLYTLRTARFKYIEAPRAELYDLSQDAGEQFNILPSAPDVARRMKGQLDRLMAETSLGAPTPEAANLDKDTVERLTALGYIGAPVAARKASGGSGPLADPKDKFEIYQKVSEAGQLASNDKYGEAAALLESALLEDPTVPQALLLLSNCYLEMGRKEEAKTQLDTVLKADPENVQALTSLGNILLEERRDEDVIALCKRALSVDEQNTQALILIAETYMGLPAMAEALPYIEKAVELQPKMDRSRLDLAVCLLSLKQYDRAEPLLQDIVRVSPKFRLAHFNLGLLYEEQGRLGEARAAYAKEVETYPAEFKARFNLGKILFKLGDRAGSLAEMRDIVRITPKLPEGHLFLARGLLYEDVPLDEVKAAVDRGLALAETAELKAMGYFLLADIYNRQREPGKMKEALRLANAYKAKKE